MSESFRSSQTEETRPESDAIRKESSMLARFKEGPAGTLARGFALMSLLATGEGCTNLDDQLHEKMQASPELTEVQKELPHRALFELLRPQGGRKVWPDFAAVYSGAQRLIQFNMLRDHLDEVAPADQQGPFLTQEQVDELIAADAAVFTASTAEELENLRAENQKYAGMRDLAARTFFENPDLFLPAVEELDEEVYGYFDVDNDGKLTGEELGQAFGARRMGTMSNIQVLGTWLHDRLASAK